MTDDNSIVSHPENVPDNEHTEIPLTVQTCGNTPDDVAQEPGPSIEINVAKQHIRLGTQLDATEPSVEIENIVIGNIFGM